MYSILEKLEVSCNIKLSGRIRQGALGGVAEMMDVSPLALDFAKYSSGVSLPEGSRLSRAEASGSLEQYNSSDIATGFYAMPQAAGVAEIDNRTGGIKLADKAYSTAVIGIISTNPAQILEEGEGAILVFVIRQ